MAPVDPLFHGQRIVRQTVVDEERAEFQVESLGSGIGGNQDLRFTLEFQDRLIRPAMVADRLPMGGKQGFEHGLRGTVFGEDQAFRRRTAFPEFGKTGTERFQQELRFCIQRNLLDSRQYLLKDGAFGVVSQTFDHAGHEFSQCCRRGGERAGKKQCQIVFLHGGESVFFLPVPVILQQGIDFFLFRRE